VAVRRGIANPPGVTGMTAETIIGEATKFLGVYSGRLGKDEMGAQLGIVWKASVLLEILEGGVRGHTPHNADSSG
jgi:hypothetical protein